jgi:hypothetical protein
MRIRSLKPEFWTDEKIGEWDAATRLAFIWTWSAADDAGRLRLTPAILRAGAFLYDESVTLAKAAEIIARLAANRRVILYRVEGEQFGEIVNWRKHQRIDNAGKPVTPERTEENTLESLGDGDDCETRREPPRLAAKEAEGAGVAGASAASRAGEKSGSTVDPDVVAVYRGHNEIVGIRSMKKVPPKMGGYIHARLLDVRQEVEDGESAVEFLLAASRGIARSPYHMGKNDTRTKYNSADWLFSSLEKVLRFREGAPDPNAERAAKERARQERIARMDAALATDKAGRQ